LHYCCVARLRDCYVARLHFKVALLLRCKVV
jgi:hypothetical protein